MYLNGYDFDHVKYKDMIVDWIKNYFQNIDCNAIIGISGGKDSSIVAALCVEALGKDRVFGILLPYGQQIDISDSKDLVDFLGIKAYVHNIWGSLDKTYAEFNYGNCLNGAIPINVSEQTKINLPARERLKVLRAYAQSLNGRLANTCNLSEEYIGYCTFDGDDRGDFSPLGDFTVTEVKEIGRLILPSRFVDKVPADGLCGKTDEENFGFPYEVLDRYIRIGKIDDESIKGKIDQLHEKNLFKLEPMPKFRYDFKLR